MQILNIFSEIITLCSTPAILIAWKWWMLFPIILLSFVSFFSIYRLNKEQFDINWKRAPLYRESWYLSYILTNDQAFKEVKLFGLGKFLLLRFNDIYMGFYEKDKYILKKRVAITILFNSITLAGLGIVIYMVVRAAYFKEILIGNLVGYIQAITLTQTSAQSVMQGILQMFQHNLYMDQLFVFLDLPSSDPVQLQRKEEGSDHIEVQNIERIEFRKVSFKYPSTGKYALQDISFILNRGQSMAIVGKNGSGKSTLIKLLLQLYKGYEGTILINDMDIRDMDKASFQRLIGVVFQDFMKYEMPIRHNIGFGNLNYLHDDQKLLEACESSGIRKLVVSLPQGLDTTLGRWLTEGTQLSGGQWQKIAIARAFFRLADLYIFDEPSSFLDPESEVEVFSKFNELTKGKIGIFISHRFSSARFADLILVMDGGEIVEKGDHYSLMKQKGLYEELYTTQMEAYYSQTGG